MRRDTEPLGGLAAASGPLLAQRGVPVTLVEAGRYPRHRVCGEFISGRGQESLARLGLLDVLKQSGAIPATSVTFCAPKFAGRIRKLPQAALCLPRHELDATLATRFRELGGDLHENERWQGTLDQAGVVMATGRKSQAVVGGWRWFGLKAHAQDVSMHADLEMHLCSSGYVGLCRQRGGVVNVCGLFRRQKTDGEAAGNWQEQLRGADGSLLRERMRQAQFVPDSFCAVAGINLKPQRAHEQSACRIGDALTMIPPVTGNGMSIAFESAELAVEPLTAWSRDGAPWGQAKQAMAQACDRQFGARLCWASCFQKTMMIPTLQSLLVTLISHSDWLWRMMFERTR